MEPRPPPLAARTSSITGKYLQRIRCNSVTVERGKKSVRIDKWLWAARFFKTRALATKACDLGRIRSNEVEAKPAREVRVSDMLRVRNEGGEFHIEVLGVTDMRPGSRGAGVVPGDRREQGAPSPRSRRAQSHAGIRSNPRTPPYQARSASYHSVPSKWVGRSPAVPIGVSGCPCL